MMTHLPMELREKFNCDQCKYITISFWHMNNHKREEHGTKSKKIIQRCECQCGKVFDSIKKLKVHKNYAHNVKLLGKKHICTICSKAFMHSSELRVCIFMSKCDNLIINFIIY